MRRRRKWDDQEDRRGLPNTSERFIKIYDEEMETEVWLEWNCNLNNPSIHRYDPDHRRMWWTAVTLESIEWCETADQIPNVQPWPGCSMSANLRLAATK